MRRLLLSVLSLAPSTRTVVHVYACAPESAWARNTRAAERLKSRGFERTVPAASVLEDVSGPRDFIVLCHRTPTKVTSGRFRLDNLPDGRVDLLARCASAAIFLSHTVRKQTRLWLLLQDAGMALCFDGNSARGMHPDERTIAAAIKRTLAVEHGAKSRADTNNGWTAHAGSLEDRLNELLQVPPGMPPRPLIQLHEKGEITLEAALPRAGDGVAKHGAVLVFGDQLGYTAEEEALIASRGGCRARCSSKGLLTSHCIILAHHAMDQDEEAKRRFWLEPCLTVDDCEE